MTARTRTAALMGLLLCVLTLLTGPATPARAEQIEPVAIELTSLSPSVLAAEGELVISGTITNTSLDVLQRVEVRLWRDATPLTTLAELDEDPDAPPRGAVMESPEARQTINAGGDLAPGESVGFTVRADLGPGASEQLWLSEPDAAYRVGAEAYGWAGNAGYQRLGRATSLIPYPGEQQVRIGTVVQLDHRPTLLPLIAEDQPPTFADGSLVTQLRGRLARLLELAADPGVTTVLDPMLYDEVVALASPHTVIGADGLPVEGSTADMATASDWLADLDRLIDEGRVVRSLYGSVDVIAAASAGRADLVAQSRAALPSDHPLATLPLWIIGPRAEISTSALTMLADASPAVVLATNLAGDDLLQSSGETTLLAVEAVRDPAVEPSVASAGEQASRQLLGERQGRPLVSLVRTEAQASESLQLPAWQQRSPLTELHQDAPTAALALTREPATEASADLIWVSDQAIAGVRTWGELIDDSEVAELQLARMISGAWSTSFADDLPARLDWLYRASQPIAELTDPQAIELRINDWVTTSADDNLLPVTLINNTSQEVLVRVHFDSENPLRIRVDDSELVAVQPGESNTVRVRPRTLGNGKVAITAQLVTSGGHPVGTPTSFVITGTEAGRVAWLIIVASGVVLLVATALRVRQVRSETRTRE